MKPPTQDIEDVYRLGENIGLTRDQIDDLAKPHIQRMGHVRGLSDVRSRKELTAIRGALADHRTPTSPAPDGPATAPLATPRQVEYIIDLLNRRRAAGDGGGFMAGPTDRAGIAQLTRSQASTYITSLKEAY